MNGLKVKDSVNFQNGKKNISPVHIHLTDSTPFHVHLKKPIKPFQPKIVNSVTSNIKTIRPVNGQKNNNFKNFMVKFADEAMPQKNSFDRSYMQKKEKGEREYLFSPEKLLREKEELLEKFKEKLDVTEKENMKLVKNMEEICEDLEKKGIRPEVYEEVDPDLNRLINSQLFLRTMAVKIDDFGTMLRHLREDRLCTYSNAELEALLTQKKILEHDLVTFDDVIVFLKKKLREMIENNSKIDDMIIEREELVNRLSFLRESYDALKKELMQIDHSAKDTFMDLENMKTKDVQSNTIIDTLRMTKAHLQRELTNKEAECNKLSTKVRELQLTIEQERQALKQAREKMEQDKEALKKATRLHKNKATQNAESLEQVNSALALKSSEMKQLTEQITSLRLQLSQVATEKLAMAAELNDLKLKLVKVETQKQSRLGSHDDDDDNYKDEKGEDDGSSCEKNSDKQRNHSVEKQEKEKLEVSLRQAQSKAQHYEGETEQLKLKVQEFQNLLEEYKNQVVFSRNEAERYRLQVDEVKQDLLKAKLEKDFELSKVLKQSELLAETSRVFTEAGNISYNNNTLKDNKLLADRLEQLDRRIITLEDENKELAVINGKREEALHQTNLRLEEKISENTALQRQVDTLMADMRRLKEADKDRITAAERSNQIHILELEGQINQLKHEISKLKREKDEIERRMNQRFYDLQDELKQSHSTNRALQNFIHFLKSSYNATFDQTPVSFSSIPNLTSYGH